MMFWILAMVAVLALGGVAAVAAGRGEPMREQGPDRAGRLPTAGPITARDLSEVRFSTVVRGYSMREVDELLQRLQQQLAAQHEEPPLRAEPPGSEAAEQGAREPTDEA